MIKRIRKTQFNVILAFIVALQLFVPIAAEAAQVNNRSITMSTSLASANNVTYDVNFDIAAGYTVGSIVVLFCAESPIIDDPCTGPSGLDVSGTTLNVQSGETGFSVHANTNTNRIVIGRIPAIAATGTLSYSFGNIINPDFNGEYYARITTYSSNDGSGVENNYGSVALVTNLPVGIETEVPPFLQLCVGVTISGYDCATVAGQYINFGELSTNQTKYATSQFVLATNAPNGATVWSYGNTLTSGNNIIPALNVPQASVAGVSQFGINLRANTSPSVGQDPVGLGAISPTIDYDTSNNFIYIGGDAIASNNGPIDWRKFTVSYIINIDSKQKPGIYTTSVVYICLANF